MTPALSPQARRSHLKALASFAFGSFSMATLTNWLGAGRALAQEAVFRSEVRLVRLLVTVKDAQGRLMGDLKKEDFQVFDNSAPQEVAVFERSTAVPLQIALLLDISASTGKDFEIETKSLNRFVKNLLAEGLPEDRVALFTFNYEVAKVTGWTRRPERIERALRPIKPEAGTSLYDAIFLASREVEEREGRKVLVVITDGGDTTSGHNFHEALMAAQRADAVIYALLITPITNDAGRNVGGENALAQFTAGTGGRVISTQVGSRMDEAFQGILRDLRTQYLLGFYPKNVPLSKNPFHSIRVAVAGGLRASTRNGYYGEALQDQPRSGPNRP